MLVVVGHTTHDYLINPAGESGVYPGGAGYTGALGASLVQNNVGLVTRIGEDYDMTNLQRLGINLDGVNQVQGGLTTLVRMNYRYEDPLQRDFSIDFNVGNDIQPADIPQSYLDTATHVHIAIMPPEQQGRFIDFLREVKPDLSLSIDTIEQFIDDYPDEVLHNFLRSDLLFLDRREFSKMPPNILEGRAAIIKYGAEGAVYTDDNQRIVVPTRRVERVVDKTASGDILAGVYLASRDLGRDVETSLKKGCEIATASVEAWGVGHLLERQYPGGPERR